jgi:hypothetical protein
VADAAGRGGRQVHPLFPVKATGAWAAEEARVRDREARAAFLRRRAARLARVKTERAALRARAAEAVAARDAATAQLAEAGALGAQAAGLRAQAEAWSADDPFAHRKKIKAAHDEGAALDRAAAHARAEGAAARAAGAAAVRAIETGEQRLLKAVVAAAPALRGAEEASLLLLWHNPALDDGQGDGRPRGGGSEGEGEGEAWVGGGRGDGGAHVEEEEEEAAAAGGLGGSALLARARGAVATLAFSPREAEGWLLPSEASASTAPDALLRNAFSQVPRRAPWR